MRSLLALLLMTRFALAEGEDAGKFDYYVLALSWSPNWCALEGDDRGSPQCENGANFGWIMHGLWPQFENGWPSFCRTGANDPSSAQTNAMADIMGTSGLAWYQWKKHGRCSGLTSADYYATARQAFENVQRPQVFRDLDKSVSLPARVVEQAFMRANPAWKPDMLTITCKAGRIQEARLCLSKDLEPQVCGADVVKDCSLTDALFDPIQ